MARIFLVDRGVWMVHKWFVDRIIAEDKTMWNFRVVKVGRAFEAIGYLDGACQGSFWHSKSEAKVLKYLAAKYPSISVILG